MISSYKVNRVNDILTKRSVFAGSWTRRKIWEHATGIDLKKLTAVQIADLLETAHKAYHAGRHATGADVVDDCVWINSVNKLIPLKALGAMTIAPGPTGKNGVRSRYYQCNYKEYY